jgi:hypothetical protein
MCVRPMRPSRVGATVRVRLPSLPDRRDSRVECHWQWACHAWPMMGRVTCGTLVAGLKFRVLRFSTVANEAIMDRHHDCHTSAGGATLPRREQGGGQPEHKVGCASVRCTILREGFHGRVAEVMANTLAATPGLKLLRT